MITRNIWKGMARGCSACLVFLCLCILVPGAWAAHEVSPSDVTANVSTNTPTKWTLDLEVQWKQPDMGTDILNGYLYKWSSSATSLNTEDTLFTNFSTTMDGTVEAKVIPPNVAKAGADFTNFDSGNVLYLHIITSYTAGTGPRVSADTVYGPFLIDNTAPVGTVRIVNSAGTSDVTSTSDTRIYLKLTAAKDPFNMYLSETPTKPATGVPFSADAVWDLAVITPGTKTIYAWFEDNAGSPGNISTSPATDSFTLLSATNISPNTATLDLAGVAATQIFRVEGTEATYTWTIINEKDPNGATVNAGTVASITVGGSGTNSVTVQGLAKGTFQLQADPNTSVTGDELTSGTITVIQTSRTNSILLNAGWNWVSFNVLPPAESRTLAAIFGANASNVEQVKTQAASVSNTSTTGGVNWIGNSLIFDKIAQGSMFKIKVRSGFTLEVTGLPIEPTTPISLNNGWTWVAYLPNSNMNWDTAVGGVLDKLTQIKSQTQSKSKPSGTWIGNLLTMSPGKGYMTQSVSGSLTYPAP
jgi:hypothetical protein